MKTKLLMSILCITIAGSLCACGSSSYEEDDSWMSKKWNDLSESEQSSAYDYFDDLLD